MNWNDQFDKIQPGDVFLKRWGDDYRCHIMLPRVPRSAKQPYMSLPSGNRDSTWNRNRSSYGNTTTKRRWVYVGTMPTNYLNQLVLNGTLR